MTPSSPHNGTNPFLLTSQGRYTAAAARSPPSSIGSSPRSSGSSSSSVTITRTTTVQGSRDAPLLHPPPRTQEDAPPAYAPLSLNSPRGPPSQPRTPDVMPPPVFDLYSAHAHEFGPTPLGRAATVPFAAYIEAPGASDARAYRRFVGALAVALVVCAVVGVAAVLEIVGEGEWAADG